MFLFASAQVTFTTSQTITTNQTYPLPVSISTGTITIASGIFTVNGNFSIGSGGTLIIQNGAQVIVNDVMSIGAGALSKVNDITFLKRSFLGKIEKLHE